MKNKLTDKEQREGGGKKWFCVHITNLLAADISYIRPYVARAFSSSSVL